LYLGTDVGVWGVHVKAFNALTGAEIKSFDLRNPSAGIYTFDIGGDGRDLLIGGENTDRARTEVKIEFTWLVHLDRAPNEPGDSIDPPTFEVVDKDTGRTTVRGELVKVGTGHLVLSNVNTY
jgi:hypothetical protein